MRAPRTRFAASLVVTLAAASCGRTVDHREPIHPNPPPVTTGDPTPPPTTTPPDSAGTVWSVIVRSDGTCSAMQEVSCPEGAACNPPPPAKITCPAGSDQIHYMIHAEADGSCRLIAPPPECPANAHCNPPRPQTIDCPKD